MPKDERIYKFEISHRTIIFTVFFLLFLKLLWLAYDILFSLFIAFIIMSAVKPLVERLEKLKFPRSLATILVFFTLFFLIGYGFYWFFPPLIFEFLIFSKNFPSIIQKLIPNLNELINFSSFSQYLPNVTNQLFNVVKNIFSNAIFVISTIFFSFYFVLEERFIKKLLINFFEEKRAEKIENIFKKVEKRLQAWFWGELFLMFLVGILTFIGLTAIGVKYALFLAIVAGLLEVVPNLGPVLSTVPAVIVAFSQSYFLGLSTIALYFIVQQLENNLIVPLVMKKAVGLNPIVTLIALLVGGKLGGVLGVLLAIPFTLFVEVILMEIIKEKNN
jgi:predicted PurR-regulated permease PerM